MGYSSIAAKQGRLLGTMRPVSAGNGESSRIKRLQWNLYNRVPAQLFTCPGYVDNDANTSWTTTATSWTSANAGTNSKVEFLLGLSLDAVNYSANAITQNDASNSPSRFGVGEDSSTTAKILSFMLQASTSESAVGSISRRSTFGIGYHFLDLLVCVNSPQIGTYYADLSRLGGSADTPCTFLSAEVVA